MLMQYTVVAIQMNKEICDNTSSICIVQISSRTFSILVMGTVAGI